MAEQLQLQAAQRRGERRAERARQELLDREREESFEAWQNAQAMQGQNTPHEIEESSDEEEEPMSVQSTVPKSMSDVNDTWLEEQLAAEKRALEADRERAEKKSA